MPTCETDSMDASNASPTTPSFPHHGAEHGAKVSREHLRILEALNIDWADRGEAGLLNAVICNAITDVMLLVAATDEEACESLVGLGAVNISLRGILARLKSGQDVADLISNAAREVAE